MREAIDRLEIAEELERTKRRPGEQLCEIVRFYDSNSEPVIPLLRRRKIERLANALRDELAGLGGLDAGFLDTLHALSQPHPAHLRAARESNRGGAKRGGARPTAHRTLKGSVLGMIVRAYFEACAEPGFSQNGPLFRFANAIGERILGETNPFTNDAVRAEFKARRKKDGAALERRHTLMRAWMNFHDHPGSKNE